MDKSNKSHGPRCIICQKFFTPNPRLGDRQRCCGEKKCRQEYKNQWQREKYKSDMQYRKSVKIRVYRHRWNHHGSEPGRSPPTNPAALELQQIRAATADLEAMINGLAAHTTGCRDHRELGSILSGYAEHGRKIMLAARAP